MDCFDDIICLIHAQDRIYFSRTCSPYYTDSFCSSKYHFFVEIYLHSTKNLVDYEDRQYRNKVVENCLFMRA
uniref:Ovule protein n=1 Tax=Parascaris univalens TaxID=6257 RepID=A0A915A9Q3_PARUN